MKFLVVFVPITFGCSPQETAQQAERSFAQNVESCICRYLDIEEDHYSGFTYEYFIDDCNEIVHDSNPSRYSETLRAEPGLSELRCQEYVKPWLEEVEESENLQENYRELLKDLRGVVPADPESSDTK